MLKLFDYIYYRIYKFSKEKGDIAPETNGALILALMQFLTLLDLIIIGGILFNYSLPSSKYYFLPLGVLLGVINWYRYEKKLDIEQLVGKWENEDKKKSVLNGWLIVLYLLFFAAFPALYGMATHGQI